MGEGGDEEEDLSSALLPAALTVLRQILRVRIWFLPTV